MTVPAVRSAAYGRRRNPMFTAEPHVGQRPPNYGKRYPPEVYTPEEIAGLLRHCGRGPGGYRNRAIIAVQVRSGLRVGEALALELKDLDFSLGAITVMEGKGSKRRMVHMDEHTAGFLELWIRGPRARLHLPRTAPLFCTYERGNTGKPVRYAYFEQALKRAGARAGITKRVHSHGLRHTFAFMMLLEGWDLVMLQQALGHTDLGTTQRYVSHRFPLQMIRELRQRVWPAAMLAGVPGLPDTAGPRNSSKSPAPADPDGARAPASWPARAPIPGPWPPGDQPDPRTLRTSTTAVG
jgi:site-specific recombinase XerD